MKGGRLQAYETKAERIAYLEGIIEAIAKCDNLALAHSLANSMTKRGGRFRKQSPLGYLALKAEEEAAPIPSALLRHSLNEGK